MVIPSFPAFFYVHTDWLEFAEKSLGLETQAPDRIRRLLRAFYRSFNGLIVLNSEHAEWLAGPGMGIPRAKITATAHWVGGHFRPQPISPTHAFPGIRPHEKVLLFVGRISEKKGVMQLPAIYAALSEFPEVRVVVAGDGPAREKLGAALPEALYLGWVDRAELPRLYSSADLLLLPSRFDTFGSVVLEAMSCGLPVVAYDTKGRRDIVRNGVNGFLAKSESEFSSLVARYLADKDLQASMRLSALEASSRFHPDDILKRLLGDLGISGHRRTSRPAREPRSAGGMSSKRSPGANYSSIFSELLDIVSTGSRN